MKRYLLPVVLGVFAVGTIGSYYTFASKGGMPEYGLTTVEGDATIGETFEVSGSYVGGIGSKSLTLSESGGTQYGSETGYYERIRSSHYFTNADEDVRRLKKEHRSFMRSKDNLAGLYEDEQYVLYAEAYTLPRENDIPAVLKYERLDKATGKNVKISRTFDNDAYNGWIRAMDVQRVGEEVHVLIEQDGFKKDENGQWIRNLGKQRFRVLTIDLNTGETVRDKTIDLSEELSGPSQFNWSTISNKRVTEPSDYVVLEFSGTEYGDNSEDANRTENTPNAEEEKSRIKRQIKLLAAYDYRTGETKTIRKQDVRDPKETKLAFREEYALSGTKLTILSQNGRMIRLESYDLASGNATGEKIEINADGLGGNEFYSVRFDDDRIYALVERKKQAEDQMNGVTARDRFVVALDATNGSLLYRGEPNYAGDASEAERQLKLLLLSNIGVK